VALVTYNHERFIADALDGVLMQEVSFPFEIVVSEDCSTDRTREILLDYARRYPALLHLLLAERNVGSIPAVLTRALDAARGDYVALLDGDDYWTSPHKLQRQVDFLDSHPSCALCFHPTELRYDGDVPPRLWPPPSPKLFSSLEDIVAGNFIDTCSAMLRRNAVVPLPAWYASVEYEDWPLYVIAAHHGLLGYIDEPMAVYRKHPGGYWTGQDAKRRLEGVLRMYDRLIAHLDQRSADIVREKREGVETMLKEMGGSASAAHGQEHGVPAILDDENGSTRR
jgi:glycosyltransferase involved in cell wall biosynthesis